MDARIGPARLRQLGIGLSAGVLLVTAAGLAGAAAADPFVAGQPAARPLALPDGGRAALDRADRLLDALRIPRSAARNVERLDDRLESAVYDEVTLRDEQGRPTAIVRLHADGSLRHLVRLGMPSPPARPIPASEAPAMARSIARAAGLEPTGDPAVRPDPAGGWAVAWPRVEAGALVAGDGVWVRLDGDGAVRSVARTASRLAPPPAARLSEAAARQAAERELDARMTAAARAATRVTSARLEWVAPNDTFDPSRPDAPAAEKRLAWVVRVAATGALADRLRALELDIDAGTGALLGGDVVE